MQLKLLILSLFIAPMAYGQALSNVPPLRGMFISSDGTGNPGTWQPEPGSGTSVLPNTVPPAIGAYCSNDSTGNPGTWVPCKQPSQTTGLRIFTSQCTGTASSSSTTLSMFGMGGNNIGCTGTFQAVGIIMVSSGTLANLAVRCATPGVNASSGVFNIHDLRGGVDTVTPITVTYGTTAASAIVSDTTHTYAYQTGDLVRLEFSTQATETLAACSVTFSY